MRIGTVNEDLTEILFGGCIFQRWHLYGRHFFGHAAPPQATGIFGGYGPRTRMSITYYLETLTTWGEVGGRMELSDGEIKEEAVMQGEEYGHVH